LANTVQHDFEDGFNPEMEHISRLLDHMIVREPHGRATLGNVIRSAKRIQRLIERGMNAAGEKVPQLCTYCGWGRYNKVAQDASSVSNFGFHIVGVPKWRIFACGECGHVQMFRGDYAKIGSWWDR